MAKRGDRHGLWRGSIGQEKGSLAELVKDQSDSSYLTFSLMTLEHKLGMC